MVEQTQRRRVEIVVVETVTGRVVRRLDATGRTPSAVEAAVRTMNWVLPVQHHAEEREERAA